MEGTPPKPIKANVILMPLLHEQVSAGGIILMTDPNPKEPPKGLVLAIGPQVTEVEEGNVVYYNQHATKPIEHEGQTYLIVNVHDILAIITQDDDTGDSRA
jgi:co-chaperonin GroES (HSP10)